MIIANYSSKAIDLLLPELLKGMLDSSWRIRQSSISLTGELLYRVTGISGKVELEEEEAPAHTADTARKALLEALGPERKDRVLATLYIVRQDAVGVVRQASIHIWKALVHSESASNSLDRAYARHAPCHAGDPACAHAAHHVPFGQPRGRPARDGLANPWRAVQEEWRTHLRRDPADSAKGHLVTGRADQRGRLLGLCRCHVGRSVYQGCRG